MSSSGHHTPWSALMALMAGLRQRPPSPKTADLQPDQPETVEPPPFRSLIAYFLELGSLGFGGPIATVGYMQRDLVEQRRWMSRQDLLDGIALGQTMPGPLAAQVAMWVGYLKRGALGALGTAAAFIAPSFLMVLAIVVLAAWELARLTDGKDVRLWAISFAVGVVTAVTGTEVALLIIAAGLLILVWDAPPGWIPWRGAAASLAMPLQSLPWLGSLAGASVLLGLFLFFLT